jgi:hypothetical protein
MVQTPASLRRTYVESIRFVVAKLFDTKQEMHPSTLDNPK